MQHILTLYPQKTSNVNFSKQLNYNNNFNIS